MAETTGRFETEHGRKYMIQLCKHFGHKVEVSYDDTHGECRFGWGAASFDADDQALTIRIDVADEEQLSRAKAIVDDHLARFAFREPGRAIQWSA